MSLPGLGKLSFLPPGCWSAKEENKLEQAAAHRAAAWRAAAWEAAAWRAAASCAEPGLAAAVQDVPLPGEM